MTCTQDREYEAIPDSEDELDFLAETTPTLAGSGLTTPTRSGSVTSPSRTSKRLITRNASVTRLQVTPKAASRKRKAVGDASEGQRAEVAQKKSRTEKKAQTVVINSKRVAVEAARGRWLYRHQALFTPLLPPSSNFFANLANEITHSSDGGAYVPLKQLTTQPESVTGGELKDYQLQGLSFLVWMHNNGMNSILGDEMGLGKTLQTLSLLAYIKELAPESTDQHLVVCPLSVVETWLKEAARWVPSLRMFRFHAQQSERDRLKLAVRDGKIEFDICVTTYEGYAAEDTWFKSRRWSYIVLDEGHKIKNSGTMLANKLQGIGSMHKLILTGTPVQNNLIELWGLLHWLYPNIFTATTQRLFQTAFDLGHGTYSTSFLTHTEKLLSTIMLRRTKKTVDIDVPPREELTVFIPMTEAQRFWTYRLLMRLDTAELEAIFTTKAEDENQMDDVSRAYIASKIKEGKTKQQNRWKRLMNLLMQLRQVCDHPYLLPDAEPEPFSIGEHLTAASSKLIFLDKLLKDLLPKGDRVLIFSQWTRMLDLLEDFMALRGIPYARLDGSTLRPRRALDIKLFQQEKSPYQVFLISTKAGGLGINLTKASTVIMFDSEWNPQNDLQAIARAHRIGQTKVVKVYRLICHGSVEDQMLDRLRRKLFLSLKIMSSDSNDDNKHNSALKTHELMEILRKGSSALSHASSLPLSKFLGSGIQEILEASRTRDDYRSVKIKRELGQEVKIEEEEKFVLDAEEEERKLLSGVAQVQSRLFEGQVVQRAKDNKEVAAEWQALQKRARQTRIVMVDGYEVLAEHLGPEADVVKTPKQKSRRKFESEDWCIHCRDGGELVLCGNCPRVFHAQCQGLSKTAIKNARGPILCPQHACTECHRSTSDCGGMLFRCQTCPRAFCEDCLPEGDLDAIGDTLPEFVLRNFGATTTAYYIRCAVCHEHWKEYPADWEQWQEEMRETQEKLAALEIE